MLATTDDPSEVAIFDRAGLRNASSHRSTWALLAMIAAAILILDVAVRRIVPDMQRREVLARRAAEGQPEVHPTAAAAWKRVRTAAKRRSAEKSSAAVRPVQRDQEPESDAECANENDDSAAQSTLDRLREVRRRLRDKDGSP